MNIWMGRSVRANVTYVLILLFAINALYLLVVQQTRFFLVPSKSMAPTLVPQEYLLTQREGNYERGDIVVLKDPQSPGEYLVKRIVALGGDRVSVQGGALFLNGTFMSEPYVSEPIAYAIEPSYQVPQGEVFVLGDNRNWSVDSHNWNASNPDMHEIAGVPEASIIGKVKFVYLPVDKARKVKHFPLTNYLDLAKRH